MNMCLWRCLLLLLVCAKGDWRLVMASVGEHRRLSECDSKVQEITIPESSQVVSLTPFLLQFKLTSNSVNDCELETIGSLVNDYLDAFTSDYINAEKLSYHLMMVKTNLVSHAQNEESGELIIEFESWAVFNIDSETIPNIHILDTVLEMAFQESSRTDFLDLLYFLPSTNLFRGSDDVVFAFVPADVRTTAQVRSGSTMIPMSPFSLIYKLPATKNPSAFDILALEKVTNMHLRTFVMVDLRLSAALINHFSTSIIAHHISHGYVDISFESVLEMKENGPVYIPTVKHLDDVRRRAFSDDNLIDYTEILDELPSTNAFSYTLFVQNDDETFMEQDDTSKSWSGSDIALVVCFVLGVKMLFLGTWLFCRSYCHHRKRIDSNQGTEKESFNSHSRSTVKTTSNRPSMIWQVQPGYIQPVDDEMEQRIVTAIRKHQNYEEPNHVLSCQHDSISTFMKTNEGMYDNEIQMAVSSLTDTSHLPVHRYKNHRRKVAQIGFTSREKDRSQLPFFTTSHDRNVHEDSSSFPEEFYSTIHTKATLMSCLQQSDISASDKKYDVRSNHRDVKIQRVARLSSDIMSTSEEASQDESSSLGDDYSTISTTSSTTTIRTTATSETPLSEAHEQECSQTAENGGNRWDTHKLAENSDDFSILSSLTGTDRYHFQRRRQSFSR